MSVNKLNSILAWLSIFLTAWLLILKKIPSDGITWGFFSFFVIVAIIAGLFSAVREEKK